ncbi:hypothetical protein PR048_026277 [Dryococelus australis]|uniref:Uncharacterized protein n=1 Tax=Dryococelus australis TaxID=614101 RepID=A0ABQ9GKW9_9NEOP|nr:hypothetical protein PR048_026277 [Dryococelus australis]
MSSDSTPGHSDTQKEQRRWPSTNASRIDSDDDDSDYITLLDSDVLLGSLKSDDDNDDITTPKPSKQFTEILTTPQTRPLAEIKRRRKFINYKAVKINKNLFPEHK